jgi:predicted ATPase
LYPSWHFPSLWRQVERHGFTYLFSLLGRDGAARITLRALGDDAVAALLTDAFGAPPEEALLALANGAGGNPWLLTELIGGLRDDHAMRTTGGRAVLVSEELPRRVSLAGRQRLAGLSGRTGHLLMTAAVLGASFRLEDAAEMLGETPAALLPAIEEAMGAGLVTAAEHAFSFRPELLRRAVGDMIPSALRDALHRQYGQILLRRGDSAAEAAGHLLEAARHGDPSANSASAHASSSPASPRSGVSGPCRRQSAVPTRGRAV